jgi:hypothetical protein
MDGWVDGCIDVCMYAWMMTLINRQATLCLNSIKRRDVDLDLVIDRSLFAEKPVFCGQHGGDDSIALDLSNLTFYTGTALSLFSYHTNNGVERIDTCLPSLGLIERYPTNLRLRDNLHSMHDCLLTGWL